MKFVEIEMKPRLVDFYMDVARRTSQLSYAEKLKVGAILVKNDNIVSFSWNGTPRGWDNVCEDKIYTENDEFYLKTKPCVTHAEEALLMKIAASNESAEGSTLFCTHSCCMSCAKLIYGAKIKEFYYADEYRSTEGIEFLEKCGIKVFKIS